MPFDFSWHKPNHQRECWAQSQSHYTLQVQQKHPQLVSAGTFHRRSEFKRQKPGHPQVPAQVCTPAGSQGHGQCPGDTAGAGRQRLPGIKEPHRVSSDPCRPARPLQASPRPADRPPGSRGGVASRKGVILLSLQPLPLPPIVPKTDTEPPPPLPSMATCLWGSHPRPMDPWGFLHRT